MARLLLSVAQDSGWTSEDRNSATGALERLEAALLVLREQLLRVAPPDGGGPSNCAGHDGRTAGQYAAAYIAGK